MRYLSSICCNLLQTRHGLGESEKDIVTRVHGCTPDEGSNMLKAWKIFEGAGCVCHRAQNSLKKAMETVEAVVDLMKKIKGITAHFHRSTKVYPHIFFCQPNNCLTCLLRNDSNFLLYYLQAWNHLMSRLAAERPNSPVPNKPPMASATRWAGQLVTLEWVVTSKAALKIYDSDPAEDCAVNDDGTTYVEHLLSEEEWSMAEQLVSAAALSLTAAATECHLSVCHSISLHLTATDLYWCCHCTSDHCASAHEDFHPLNGADEASHHFPRSTYGPQDVAAFGSCQTEVGEGISRRNSRKRNS